jgi:microcystin-dependent protein
MTSTFTPNFQLEKPARNDDLNTWDVPVNANWDAIDGKVAGTTSVALSNVNVSLTPAQAKCANLVFTGTLTSNIIVAFPANWGGVYSVLNGTTGAFTVTLQISGSSGAVIQVGQGYRTLIILDQTNIYLADQGGIPPGTSLPFLGSTVPPGFILAYGQNVSRTTYAALFYVFGTTFGAGDGSTTFGIPDLRGKTLAGRDNMGGSAANILTSFGSSGQTLGATGGEQAHTLVTAELAAHTHATTDPNHTHGITDPTHAHPPAAGVTYYMGNPGGGGPLAGGGGFTYALSVGSGNAATGITNNPAATGVTVQNAGSGSSHNNLQPTMLVNWIIKT